MKNDIKEVIVSCDEIKDICSRLGKQITEEYKGKDCVMLGLLNGCIPFIADLSKHIDLPVEFAYMDVSSYYGGLESSGDLKIKYDLQVSIKDKHVLIVEDIVDTGKTLSTIAELIKYRQAASVEIVTLLDKPTNRKVEVTPKYIGKTIPNEFVVGYGLDYQEKYRNLPFVGILKEKIYSN